MSDANTICSNPSSLLRSTASQVIHLLALLLMQDAASARGGHSRRQLRASAPPAAVQLGTVQAPQALAPSAASATATSTTSVPASSIKAVSTLPAPPAAPPTLPESGRYVNPRLGYKAATPPVVGKRFDEGWQSFLSGDLKAADQRFLALEARVKRGVAFKLHKGDFDGDVLLGL